MAEEVAVNMKIDTKQAIQNMQKLESEIKEAKDLTMELKNENLKLERQLQKTKGGEAIKKINKQLKDNRLLIKENTQAVAERNVKLSDTKAIVKNNLETKKLNQSLIKSSGATTALDKATGGLFSKFTSGIGTLKTLIKSTNLFKLALAGTGIGLIVVALGSLVAAFTSTEEGTDKLNKALNMVKSVFDNLVDLAAEFGNGLLSLGGAIKKAFSGDFKGAIEQAGGAFDNFKDKASGFAEEVKEDAKIAGQISDELARANKIDRALIVEREKANVRINDLRIKGYDIEKFNAEERIGFLEEALAVENEITDKEINAAKLRRDAQIEANKIAGSTQEELDKEAELTAKVISLEAKKLNRQREVISTLNSLRRQDRQQRDKERKEEFDAFKKDLEDKMKLERGQLTSVADLRKEFSDKNLAALDISEEVRIEMEREKSLQELDSIKVADGLKGMARMEIETFYDNQIQANKDENSKKLLELEDKRKQAYLDATDAVIMAAGEESKVGKALFLLKTGFIIKEQIMDAKATMAKILNKAAEATVDGATGFMKAASSAPPPANIPLIAIFAAQAAGIAMSIKSAVSAAKGLVGGSAGGGSAGGTSLPRATPPSFNVVGASPENQLAQAIGDQNERPIKAFVTASDVSTAQSLERNIIENAAIG